jgi:hypothetical protein
MKVQIIYLDIHDDHISARDKLNWAQTPRVALVWPKEGKVLSSRLDLALVYHHARQLGRQIALVTQDRDVQRNAQDLGFPYAASLSDLPEDDWPSAAIPLSPLPAGKADLWAQPHPLPSPPARSSPAAGPSGGIRWLWFGSGLLAVFLLFAFLLPSASAVITPPTSPTLMNMRLELDPDACASGGSACVPAEQVGVRTQTELRLPTSGRVSVPESRADGEVLFINLTDRPVVIPAGTGVRSSERPEARFETSDPLQLEGKIGARGAVGVTALDPGSRSNLPAGAIDAVDGPLGLDVSVSNPEPTSGGGETYQAGVSAQDVLRLREDLRQQLLQQVRATIERSLPASSRLAEGSLKIAEIFSETLDHTTGEATETIHGSMEARISALIYEQAGMTAAAYQVAQAHLGPSRQIAAGSMSLAQIGELRLGSDGIATLQARARFETFRSLDLGSLVRAIRGKPVQEAATILAREHGLTLRDLEVTPAWLPWMPWLATRIELRMSWGGR